MTIPSVRLDVRSESQLLTLVGRLLGHRAADLATVRAARHLVSELPENLRSLPKQLDSGRCGPGAVVVRGIPLDGLDALPTPQSFSETPSAVVTSATDMSMLLIGAVFGVPYCFASQQRGQMVLDVFPVRGYEGDQLGSSSTATLDWHNEDAFHPQRAHYSALLCVRNPQRVGTRCLFAGDLDLPAQVVKELSQPQFRIVPDDSHGYAYNVATTGLHPGAIGAFSEIEEMASEGTRIPVLQPNSSGPLICVDFAYMPQDLHSPRARAALAVLREAIEQAAQSVVLEPGDMLILDNRRCVHGRESFAARFDGTDRWLRRLNIGSDEAAVLARAIAPDTVQIA
jgi:Fe(II)/alpha-ketoglutarate-dependent arginine beta-hydroxylase